MTHHRMRPAVVASSLALTMCLAAAPMATAQDDPTTPVNDVLTAFAEGRYADAATHFCAELEGDALGGLSQIDALAQMGLGYDLDLLFGALAVDVSGLEVGVVEEGAEEAVVGVDGTIEVGFDEDGIIAFMMAMFSTEDSPMDEETIRGMLPMMMPQIEAMVGGSVEVDQDVRVVLEDGRWQVCDDLSSLGDALAAAMGATGADTAAGVAGDEPTVEPTDQPAEGQEGADA
jgi:hypothetical protein